MYKVYRWGILQGEFPTEQEAKGFLLNQICDWDYIEALIERPDGSTYMWFQ